MCTIHVVYILYGNIHVCILYMWNNIEKEVIVDILVLSTLKLRVWSLNTVLSCLFIWDTQGIYPFILKGPYLLETWLIPNLDQEMYKRSLNC